MKEIKLYNTNSEYYFSDKECADVYLIADEDGPIKSVVFMGLVWFELDDKAYFEDLNENGLLYMDEVAEKGYHSGNYAFDKVLKNYENLYKITK